MNQGYGNNIGGNSTVFWNGTSIVNDPTKYNKEHHDYNGSGPTGYRRMDEAELTLYHIARDKILGAVHAQVMRIDRFISCYRSKSVDKNIIGSQLGPIYIEMGFHNTASIFDKLTTFKDKLLVLSAGIYMDIDPPVFQSANLQRWEPFGAEWGSVRDGYYNPFTGVLAYSPDVLKPGRLSDLIGVIAHESAHKYLNADHNSVNFDGNLDAEFRSAYTYGNFFNALPK